MANLRSVVSRALAICALSLSSIHVAAEPQNGWWWNSNESGRGYFIQLTGGVFYLAGHFYDNSGRAAWMPASGAVTDPYSIKRRTQIRKHARGRQPVPPNPGAPFPVRGLTQGAG